MSDNKREQERTELYRTIWALANELRGSVDGWDFKQYVLGMLFYRYISENLTTYLNKGEWDAGNTDFDYAKISDEEALSVKDDMVQEKGFFILPSELFGNLLNRIKKADKDAKAQAEKDGKEVEIADLDENLNEILQTNFKNIEASAIGSSSEENFKGLFDDIDVNSNKLGPTVIKRNKRLKRLITVIGDMDLGNYQDNSIDAFGDTYEYLMGMYASNAGKSGGEFFTPQEVSELLTKISLLDNNGKMKTEVNKVYDPAVGSGSLLLKFAKILGKDNVRNGFFGQEINITTYNLCRINMFLHDMDGYEDEHGKHIEGYNELVARLEDEFPISSQIIGEDNEKEFIKLFGRILKLRNILRCFDDFESDSSVSVRDLQDYQSIYIDLFQDYAKKSDIEKERINDDIVFEIELIKQVEVNIDYILMLVAKYHESNCEDKTILANINKSIDASVELRSKKALIEGFVAQMTVKTDVEKDWKDFVKKQKEHDLEAIIKDEKLKHDEAQKFIENSFRDGGIKTTGTDLDKILPPISRFSGGSNRALKKQTVIDKLKDFFEKYFGLV